MTEVLYRLVSVLEFDDNVTSVSLVHSGTKEECQLVADLIPAVAYNGPPKKIIASYLSLMSDEQYQWIMAQGTANYEQAQEAAKDGTV